MSGTENDRPIQGFKNKEFATDRPEEVFESSEIRVEDLPEGVRLFLRGKAVDLATKKLTVRIYRLKNEGGVKDLRESVGILINRFPEEEDVGEMYGPGRYIAIGKWKSATGVERGIITEPMLIGEDWRPAHEAWKRAQSGAPAAGLPAVPAAAPAASPLGNVEGILRIMAAAEEKSLATFERIAAIMGGSRQESPVEVLKTAYQGANQMIMDSVKQVQDMAKSVKDKAKADLRDDQGGDDDDDQEEGAAAGSDPMPDWVNAFMPQIKQWLGTLLGGGPMGNAVKTIVLGSEQWQEIFRDKDKWGVAVAAMEAEFGTEQTAAALKVLLNKREPKGAPAPAVPSKGKGKGKR